MLVELICFFVNFESLIFDNLLEDKPEVLDLLNGGRLIVFLSAKAVRVGGVENFVHVYFFGEFRIRGCIVVRYIAAEVSIGNIRDILALWRILRRIACRMRRTSIRKEGCISRGYDAANTVLDRRTLTLFIKNVVL